MRRDKRRELELEVRRDVDTAMREELDRLKDVSRTSLSTGSRDGVVRSRGGTWENHAMWIQTSPLLSEAAYVPRGSGRTFPNVSGMLISWC